MRLHKCILAPAHASAIHMRAAGCQNRLLAAQPPPPPPPPPFQRCVFGLRLSAPFIHTTFTTTSCHARRHVLLEHFPTPVCVGAVAPRMRGLLVDLLVRRVRERGRERGSPLPIVVACTCAHACFGCAFYVFHCCCGEAGVGLARCRPVLCVAPRVPFPRVFFASLNKAHERSNRVDRGHAHARIEGWGGAAAMGIVTKSVSRRCAQL